MFPGESTSCTSPESYISSSFCSPGSTLTIPAENSSSSCSYTHPFLHPLYPAQLQQTTSHSSASYTPGMAARNTETASNLHPSIQAAIAAGYLSEEEAQLLILQESGGCSYALHATQQVHAGLSMNPVHAQYYNEQVLRSVSGHGAHYTGIEPTENQELLNSMQQLAQQSYSSSSHAVLQNLNLEQNMNLGRSISGAGGHVAPVRYEETCTPRPRWSPTPEQIEILEALFNSGTRTPSRDMIADIAVQLRKYGTIAEANVFYWFQNRKARAKRKQLQPPSR